MNKTEETIAAKDIANGIYGRGSNGVYGMGVYDMTGGFNRPIYVDTEFFKHFTHDEDRAKDLFNLAVKIADYPQRLRINDRDLPNIAQVYFNKTKGTTTVKWVDDTTTTVTCDKEDTFDLHTGISLCITKKILGNKSNFNNIIKKAADSAIESSKRKANKKHE